MAKDRPEIPGTAKKKKKKTKERGWRGEKERFVRNEREVETADAIEKMEGSDVGKTGFGR